MDSQRNNPKKTSPEAFKYEQKKSSFFSSFLFKKSPPFSITGFVKTDYFTFTMKKKEHSSGKSNATIPMIGFLFLLNQWKFNAVNTHGMKEDSILECCLESSSAVIYLHWHIVEQPTTEKKRKIKWARDDHIQVD